MNSKMVCKTVCGDGFQVGDEKCDAGTSDGCLDDCSGSKDGFKCSQGSSTAPSFCSSAITQEAMDTISSA